MSCQQGCWCFSSFLLPRLRVLYLLNQDERASKAGTYGIPFNRIICAGVSKGPLVCAFHFASVWLVMKKMMMMMVVIGVAMGKGVEIGAELVLLSR